MAHEKPAKLKLTKLEFLSSCDFPAQGEGGAALLLKRNADKFSLKAKVAKMSDELGLVFGYAFATSMDGGKTPHVDYQNDAIDPDFLKVVTDFIEAGGKTDVNHDFEKDGKIVYAWPLTPEINKAMGIESDVFGLAVAVKPSAETYKRFKDGELTGFSIAGEGVREPLEKAKARKSRVVKSQLYTDEVDGHQHQICVYDDGTMYVQYATSAGADCSHSHGIVFEGGTLTILADSGHTHSLAEGQPGVAIVPADAIVVVAARRTPTTTATPAQSRASGSPRSATAPTVNSHTEKSTMKTAEEKLADLEKSHADTTKRLERAERIAKMSGAHKTHFDTLTGEEADTFLTKSDVERSQTLEALERADPIEFSLDGVAYRKSTQGYPLAKRLLAEVEKNEALDIEKAATSMLGGASDPEKIVAKAIRSIAKKEDREAAEKLVKGLVATSRIGKAAQGSDAGAAPGSDAGTPLQALTKGLVEFCKAEKIDERSMWTVGLPKFEQTEKGRDLKTSYDESLAG